MLGHVCKELNTLMISEPYLMPTTHVESLAATEFASASAATEEVLDVSI